MNVRMLATWVIILGGWECDCCGYFIPNTYPVPLPLICPKCERDNPREVDCDRDT